jgi:hypothetical protein
MPMKTARSNGSLPALDSAAGGAPVPARSPEAVRPPELGTVVAALGTEVRLLSRKVDAVGTFLGLSGESVAPTVGGELVGQISQAMAAALNEHRLVMERELQQAKRELLLHIDSIDETPTAPPVAPAELLHEIDSRFKWLVQALSERLVLIGNELVRLEEQLGVAPSVAAAGHGHSSGNGKVRVVAPAPEQAH